MPLVKARDLTVFTFGNLSKITWVAHAISTRTGGMSPPPYESLNLSWTTGDKKETVLKNRKLFFGMFRKEEDDVVEMKQVHGDHVAVVGQAEKGTTVLERDAIITGTPGVVLLVKSADCVPILLIDPVKRVVGALHAGWRGTAAEIARLTIDHMEDYFGTRAENVVAGVGPSIGPCCYEIDTPVINAFNGFSYRDKLFTKQYDDRANFNLWDANKFQLIERGVKEKNIEVAGICTKDNNNLFFSDRGLGKPGGRFGGVIFIK